MISLHSQKTNCSRIARNCKRAEASLFNVIDAVQNFSRGDTTEIDWNGLAFDLQLVLEYAHIADDLVADVLSAHEPKRSAP